MRPRPETLKRIELEIAGGDLGKARVRLHGLVARFPHDLSLRKRLGDVYHRLQYPERAGCFWYLEQHKTEEMKRVCDTFVRSKGGDPLQILRGLGIHVDPESFPAGHARDVLMSLKSKAPGYRFTIRQEPGPPPAPKGFHDKARDALMLTGCAMVAIWVVGTFLAGIFTLIMWGRGYDFK